MPKASISNLCELCRSVPLREINNPTICFEKAIKCDPLEYWAVVERDGFAAAEKNRGLKAQQLLECVSDYWGIGCYEEVIALCDAALAKSAAEKPYKTEGATAGFYRVKVYVTAPQNNQ